MEVVTDTTGIVNLVTRPYQRPESLLKPTTPKTENLEGHPTPFSKSAISQRKSDNSSLIEASSSKNDNSHSGKISSSFFIPNKIDNEQVSNYYSFFAIKCYSIQASIGWALGKWTFDQRLISSYV